MNSLQQFTFWVNAFSGIAFIAAFFVNHALVRLIQSHRPLTILEDPDAMPGDPVAFRRSPEKEAIVDRLQAKKIKWLYFSMAMDALMMGCCLFQVIRTAHYVIP